MTELEATRQFAESGATHEGRGKQHPSCISRSEKIHKVESSKDGGICSNSMYSFRGPKEGIFGLPGTVRLGYVGTDKARPLELHQTELLKLNGQKPWCTILGGKTRSPSIGSKQERKPPAFVSIWEDGARGQCVSTM